MRSQLAAREKASPFGRSTSLHELRGARFHYPAEVLQPRSVCICGTPCCQYLKPRQVSQVMLQRIHRDHTPRPRTSGGDAGYMPRRIGQLIT
eukprot:6859190-Pyramimonas_sp.AAC.1